MPEKIFQVAIPDDRFYDAYHNMRLQGDGDEVLIGISTFGVTAFVACGRDPEW